MHSVLKKIIIILSIVSTSAMASTRVDLSLIEVSPHELALTQVLSEICPTLLTTKQQQKFNQAYQIQLQLLMPKLDPQLAMQQVNNQKEYRKLLGSIRKWTLSYPKEENRALCIEIAESEF